MLPTLYLTGCLLMPAQGAPTGPAAPNAGWTVAPRFERAQELVYRGLYSEEANGGSVQFARAYRIETRLYVIEVTARGADLGVQTVLRPRDTRSSTQGFSTPPPPIAHLSRAVVGPHGQLQANAPPEFTLPLDGPPLCERGMIVALPTGRINVGQGWEIAEAGRPLQLWRLAAVEMINGVSCLKLLGVQQSDDWDQPRADRTAWKRTDTVWLSPRTGLASRLERTTERREPARREATWRSTLRYDLESTLRYPGQLGEDRRTEVLQATAFARAAQPLLATPTKNLPQLNTLAAKIQYHLEKQPPTPFREAILQVQRQVEAGKRGEALVRVANPTEKPASGSDVGQLAPDFIVPFLTHAGPSFQLHRWLGRPIVLVFYQPSSPTCRDLLGFCEELAARHGKEVAVFALSLDDDVGRVRKQWTELKLSIPVLNGSALRKTYQLETTPKLFVLAPTGIIRGAYLGWGRETPAAVSRDVQECLKAR